MRIGREQACMEESKDVSVDCGRVKTVTLLTGRPEGTVDTRPETGPGVVIVVSTSISSAETVHIHLLGVLAELSGDNERSPKGAKTSERGDDGIH
ncbi:unnamed protein product [Rhizophagus irregularis]|nr:unnamed protein product [Rhizophagus irregularis]